MHMLFPLQCILLNHARGNKEIKDLIFLLVKLPMDRSGVDFSELRDTYDGPSDSAKMYCGFIF